MFSAIERPLEPVLSNRSRYGTPELIWKPVSKKTYLVYLFSTDHRLQRANAKPAKVELASDTELLLNNSLTAS